MSGKFLGDLSWFSVKYNSILQSNVKVPSGRWSGRNETPDQKIALSFWSENRIKFQKQALGNASERWFRNQGILHERPNINDESFAICLVAEFVTLKDMFVLIWWPPVSQKNVIRHTSFKATISGYFLSLTKIISFKYHAKEKCKYRK